MKDLRIDIPDDAKLGDIIWILNKMNLTLTVDDRDGATWVYKHQSWIKDEDV